MKHRPTPRPLKWVGGGSLHVWVRNDRLGVEVDRVERTPEGMYRATRAGTHVGDFATMLLAAGACGA